MANRILAWILISALGLMAFDTFEQRTSTTPPDATDLDGGNPPPPSDTDGGNPPPPK